MLLSEILADAPTKRPLNNACGIALLLNKLTDDHGKGEADAVHTRLLDLKYHATVLSTVLKKNGHDIHPNTIRRHRKKECSCYQKH